MKKYIYTLILILLSFILVSCQSNNVFTIIINKEYEEYLVMATSADYPPYEYLYYENNKLTIKGIDIEIAKKIAAAENKNLKIINKSFDFLLDDLEKGKVDFIMSAMNPTSEREQMVTFSNIYYETNNVLLINKSKQNLYLSIDDLNKNNLKVGAQLGSSQSFLIDEFLPNSNKILLKDVNSLIMQLKDNKIDAILLEEIIAREFSYQINELFLTNILVGDKDGYAVAVAKGNTTLLNTINNVLLELENSNELNEIITNESLKDFDSKKSYPFSFIINKNYLSILGKGILMTIILSILAVGFGSLLGFFVTMLRLNNNKFLNTIAKYYVEIIRGTPLLVQVLLIYSFFNLPVILLFGIDLSSFIPGVIALLINSSAYTSEIFRGGIASIDKGQTEAALSLGLNDKTIMKKIILPQAIKNIIPSLGNEFVSMIKETSIFMYLGIAELMYAAAIIQTDTYQIKEVYIFTALLYLVLTLSTSKLMNLYQKKLGVSDAK